MLQPTHTSFKFGGIYLIILLPGTSKVPNNAILDIIILNSYKGELI